MQTIDRDVKIIFFYLSYVYEVYFAEVGEGWFGYGKLNVFVI